MKQEPHELFRNLLKTANLFFIWCFSFVIFSAERRQRSPWARKYEFSAPNLRGNRNLWSSLLFAWEKYFQIFAEQTSVNTNSWLKMAHCNAGSLGKEMLEVARGQSPTLHSFEFLNCFPLLCGKGFSVGKEPGWAQIISINSPVSNQPVFDFQKNVSSTQK